jgi:hypothetical protein
MDIEGDRRLLESRLGMTGTPEWNDFIEELKKEIYQHQANILENAANWDQVVFTKGWCAALAYIINTREKTKIEIDQLEESDANVQL